MSASPASKTIMQVLAILCIVALASVILYKGFADVWVLAQKHSGGEFWLALGRYVMRNLAGG
jgi:hypothetical protein